MKKSRSFSADLASAAAAGTTAPKKNEVKKGRFTVVQNPTEEVVKTIRDGIDSDDEFFSDDDDFGFGLNDEAAEERAKELDFIYDKNNRREHFAMPRNWNAIKKELKKFRDSLEKDGHFYTVIEDIMNSKNKEEIKDNIKKALSEFSEPEYINGEYKRLIEIYKKLRLSKKVAISNMRKRALRNSRSRTRRGGKRKKTRKKRKKRRKYKSNRRRKLGRKRTKRRRNIRKVLHN